MAKEVTITFLNSSVEHRPPPSTSNGAPNQTITPDSISVKILLEIHLAIEKSPLHFEIIRRALTSANNKGYNNSPNILITTDRIFIKFFVRDRSRAKKVLIIFLEIIRGVHASTKTPAMLHPTRQKLLIIFS